MSTTETADWKREPECARVIGQVYAVGNTATVRKIMAQLGVEAKTVGDMTKREVIALGAALDGYLSARR